VRVFILHVFCLNLESVGSRMYVFRFYEKFFWSIIMVLAALEQKFPWFRVSNAGICHEQSLCISLPVCNISSRLCLVTKSTGRQNPLSSRSNLRQTVYDALQTQTLSRDASSAVG
jgi:hypothetical protein